MEEKNKKLDGRSGVEMGEGGTTRKRRKGSKTITRGKIKATS